MLLPTPVINYTNLWRYYPNQDHYHFHYPQLNCGVMVIWFVGEIKIIKKRTALVVAINLLYLGWTFSPFFGPPLIFSLRGIYYSSLLLNMNKGTNHANYCSKEQRIPLSREPLQYIVHCSTAALLIADWSTTIFNPASTSSIHTTAPSKWFDSTSADYLLLQTISS